MKTNVVRIPIVDASGVALDARIINVCTIQGAAGFTLAAMTSVQDQLILIFQSTQP